MYGKFQFNSNFFVQNQSGHQRVALPVPVAFTKEFFYFLDRIVLFLSSLDMVFFFFFTMDFLPLDFSMCKDFFVSKELPHVHFVKFQM